MKRDMDLIRELLLRIEEHARPTTALKMDFLTASDTRLQVEGSDRTQVAYHVSLLIQAGLVSGVRNSVDESQIVIKGLTWQGHDFLDKVRDPAVWHATKEGAKKAGGFSFELLGALAKGFLKKKIEEHTGVDLDL